MTSLRGSSRSHAATRAPGPIVATAPGLLRALLDQVVIKELSVAADDAG